MELQTKEMIEFAKWFIHTRRKPIRMADNVNAVFFASDLMSELCHIEPFTNEHKLMTEYNEYKKINSL